MRRQGRRDRQGVPCDARGRDRELFDYDEQHYDRRRPRGDFPCRDFRGGGCRLVFVRFDRAADGNGRRGGISRLHLPAEKRDGRGPYGPDRHDLLRRIRRPARNDPAVGRFDDRLRLRALLGRTARSPGGCRFHLQNLLHDACHDRIRHGRVQTQLFDLLRPCETRVALGRLPGALLLHDALLRTDERLGFRPQRPVARDSP